MSVKSARFASLDGMRAVSVFLVASSHAVDRTTLPVLWRCDYGNLGVRIFFVISGFLITSLLLREREQTGGIDLQEFYIRRFFRIFPTYYAFLFVVALLIPTGLLIAHFGGLLSSATFVSDYIFPAGTLGNTWSLAVEEQFYLLWPLALALLGPRRSLLTCVGIVLAVPAIRVLADLSIWPTNPMRAFEAVADALACGCLLACLRDRLWTYRIYRSVVESRWVMLIPAAPLLLMTVNFSSIVRDLVCLPILNVGIALTIDRYVRFHESRIGRTLNWKPVAWMGKISYSIYLWQQLFFFNRLPMHLFTKVTGTIVCSTASYYCIERPGLRLRERFVELRSAVA